jgi:hypothetical protein
MEYAEVEDAVGLPGLRLVLTAGVPGPWGESAKSIFAIKKISFVPVRQKAGEVDEALRAWTGQTSAPVAMYEDERARSGWSEILMLGERLEPHPRLIPEDPALRAQMLGLCFEICGEEGLAWSRRIMLLPADEEGPRDTMAWKYGAGHGSSAQEAARDRVAQVLGLLSAQLAAQHAAGSRFLIGSELSALDVYWACFSNMLVPLPPEQSPMKEWFRPIYTMDGENDPKIDPELIRHRDTIFEEFIGLPQDF